LKKIKTIFIAANTPRSRAYAQAFLAKGISVDRVIVFDRTDGRQPGKTSDTHEGGASGSVLIPDLSVPLEETLQQISDEIVHIEAENINDPGVLDAVTKAARENFDFVVYSGYGGQIISPQLLDAGLPFLHAHSGWLPEYPGSTTIYYSLIDSNGCGVSIIEMAPDIDQGPILARQNFPAPSQDIDIDYIYDSAIRADLMSDLVLSWRENGKPEIIVRPPEATQPNYYVIHPLLKHIALLSLEDQEQP
jgi:methionyl-tRNA formyltransferase